jgi:hypothetical protein
MKTILGLALAVTAGALLMAFQDDKAKTRVVLLRGAASYMMEGDPLKKDARNDGAALPRLLEDGWKIKSMHLATAPDKSSDPVGYVIVER